MNRTRIMLSMGILFGFTLGGEQAAQAQLMLTFDASAQTAPANSLLTYFGVITNTTASTIFLNGDAFAPLASGFTLDDTDFFLNAPLSLGANASTVSLALFTIQLDPALANGTFAADAFQIIGGANSGSQTIVGSANFTARVGVTPTVPEPGVISLIGAMGGASVFALSRRRRALYPH